VIRRRCRSLVAVSLAAVAATVLTGGLAASAGPASRDSLRVLQMNLCDSGIAGCYTGRSVPRAAAVIRAQAPDVVTLNEVCQDDVYALDHTLAKIYRDGDVVSTFQAAADRRTGGAFRCRNGQPYGIGLVAHIPSRRYATYSGRYPMQDAGDPEERVWLCLDAIGSFRACTTHLADTSPTVALAQCGYLWHTAIPSVWAQSNRREPTVLGGDLNLRVGVAPDVRSCLPPGYLGDGGVQYVVATDFAVNSSRSITMSGTTDHPALLVTLTPKT
jgi:hypothetical protein